MLVIKSLLQIRNLNNPIFRAGSQAMILKRLGVLEKVQRCQNECSKRFYLKNSKGTRNSRPFGVRKINVIQCSKAGNFGYILELKILLSNFMNFS